MVGSDDDHAVAELDGVVAGRDAALAAADDRGDEHGVLELEQMCIRDRGCIKNGLCQ